MGPKKVQFLDMFPNHQFRYIDQTGEQRPPVSSATLRPDLNEQGYESYFTVNGFKEANDNKKEQCTNINAFFIDIDGRKDEAELESIKEILDPSFITETKNGYHLYWLLDEVIYRDECFGNEWEEKVARWEKIEQSIVKTLKGDPVVKDLTRILRVPNTLYWKKSGDAYKKGKENAPFKIKGVYKNLANTYSMDQVEEAFPLKEDTLSFPSVPTNTSLAKFADAEKKDFFDRVNDKFPMQERESFKRLISGHPDTLPPDNKGRNHALIITATLMRQAGWTKEMALKQIEKVGWHGMEKERGGIQEIVNTINSAFQNNYTYSYKNELISFNMNPEEQMKIQKVYTEVAKDRKETDKVRFTLYEREIFARFPHLKKNEVGIIFDYKDGVYKMLSDQEVSDMILQGLYEDMLWGYRTKKSVSDKLACLISIIPELKITNDGGYIANLRNGLLNIYTRELAPHSPAFVSLIQYPVDYDANATCPVWEECINAWTEGDESEGKKAILQQFAGYCLSSSMLYDKALFLVGDGGNGKSTFVDTISRVIGSDSTSHIDLESLYGQYGLKGLIGKRLNVIEEVHGNYYQSNKLKKLISGEQVTIDIKYKDQFTFRPQAKFIFAVNQMPRVDDTSTATERRICAVLFKNNFRDNPNMQLRSSVGLLAQELSGILNWMIDGALKLKENKGFVITKEQTQMLAEYRQENSSVEGFIAECLYFEEGEDIAVQELYETYKQWCQKDGRKFKANIAFTKEMKAYGYKNKVFQYHERENGRDTSRFIGIKIAEGSGIYKSSLNNF